LRGAAKPLHLTREATASLNNQIPSAKDNTAGNKLNLTNLNTTENVIMTNQIDTTTLSVYTGKSGVRYIIGATPLMGKMKKQKLHAVFTLPIVESFVAGMVGGLAGCFVDLEAMQIEEQLACVDVTFGSLAIA
jgi:hypothetical protein